VIKRSLIIPDCHRPFHNRKAYGLMIEAASYWGVHEVVILGDYADFYSVSRWGKHPKVDTLLTQEIESVREGLREIDSVFPQARKVFLEGNHENRLERYLVDQAPALFGVTEVKFLFELEGRAEWTFQPFDRTQGYNILGTEVLAFHRPIVSNIKQHILRAGCPTVYGDVHKIECAHAVTRSGKALSALCPGWLGDTSSRVFDYMPSTPQWQLGFAIMSLETSSNEYFIDIFEIKNNQALVYGKLFKG